MATSRCINGMKLRYYRLKKKLSQTELGVLLNCDKQHISNYELGLENMSCDYIDKVLDKLGVTKEEFHFTVIDLKVLLANYDKPTNTMLNIKSTF